MRITLEDVAYRLLPRVRAGRALAHREWLTLVKVADVLLEGTLRGVSSEDTADNVEKFLIAGASRRAWRVRVLLELIEALPLATDGRPFSLLTPERRRQLIERDWIGGSGLYRVCSKVRNLVILGMYGDKRAAAENGYVPVPLRTRFRRVTSPTAEEVA